MRAEVCGCGCRENRGTTQCDRNRCPSHEMVGSTEAWDHWWQARSLSHGLETAGRRTIAVCAAPVPSQIR